MTQIIFEKQKKSKTLLPIPTLREIIQRGGGSISALLDVAKTGKAQTDLATAALDKQFAEGATAGNDDEKALINALNAKITELEAKLRAAENANKNRQPDITH
jgi:hypothetical protein